MSYAHAPNRTHLARRRDGTRGARVAAIRALGVGLLIAVAVTVAACSSPGSSPGSQRDGPGGPAGDREVSEASSAARLAYERGNFAQARTLYRRALTRAEAIGSGTQAADAAYNTAMAEIGLRNYDAAEQLLRQAEYDATRVAADTSEIRLMRAKVAYLQQRPAQALAFANDVVASSAPPRIVVQARTLRGQVYADAGDLPAAKFELQALTALGRSANGAFAPAGEADIHKLEGTIARREGAIDAAARLFEREAELLRVARRYRDMGHALARAAEAYRSAGRHAQAAQNYYLAGRSLAGQDAYDAGKTFAAASLSAAEAAGDEAARARARQLLERISRRAAP